MKKMKLVEARQLLSPTIYLYLEKVEWKKKQVLFIADSILRSLSLYVRHGK